MIFVWRLEDVVLALILIGIALYIGGLMGLYFWFRFWSWVTAKFRKQI